MRPRRLAPILGALLAVVLATACDPTAPPSVALVTPGPTSGGIATGPATEPPSSGPDPAPTYDPETLLLASNTAAAVIVDRLPVYVDPSTDAANPGLFERGDVVVLMLFEPVEVDGKRWWYAMDVPQASAGKLPSLPTPLEDVEFAMVGWIEATDDTGDTVSRLAPRCPETADFDNVFAMLPGERVACFGSTPLSLDGVLTCVDGCSGDDLIYEPRWLAGRPTGLLRDVSGQPHSIALSFPPTLEAPDETTPMRVTGHFDDPLASTCAITENGKPVSHAVAVELCRLRFVVDSWEHLSVEELPPPD